MVWISSCPQAPKSQYQTCSSLCSKFSSFRITTLSLELNTVEGVVWYWDLAPPSLPLSLPKMKGALGDNIFTHEVNHIESGVPWDFLPPAQIPQALLALPYLPSQWHQVLHLHVLGLRIMILYAKTLTCTCIAFIIIWCLQPGESVWCWRGLPWPATCTRSCKS